MVQPNFYMQNLLLSSQAIRHAQQFSLPLGGACTGIVDARDVGAVCAVALQDDVHGGRTYRITGPELLSFDDVAAKMSGVLGRPIRYVDQAPAEFHAFLSGIIPSTWHVDAVCELFAEIAGGALAETTTAVKDVAGRAPRSLEAFVRDYEMAFGT